MKRSWIGLALLLVLLGLSLLATWAMDRIHGPIAADLEQAAESAVLGDWTNADYFAQKAWSQWEKWSHFRACLADHTPTEDISAEFAAVQVYCVCRDQTNFAAACGELAKKVEAVGDAHGLVWWNVL